MRETGSPRSAPTLLKQLPKRSAEYLFEIIMRRYETGGLLTSVASCLNDTGIRMDLVIFDEFKGAGNMEIVLWREIANRRPRPAIDFEASGTRKEERPLVSEALSAS